MLAARARSRRGRPAARAATRRTPSRSRRCAHSARRRRCTCSERISPAPRSHAQPRASTASGPSASCRAAAAVGVRAHAERHRTHPRARRVRSCTSRVTTSCATPRRLPASSTSCSAATCSSIRRRDGCARPRAPARRRRPGRNVAPRRSRPPLHRGRGVSHFAPPTAGGRRGSTQPRSSQRVSPTRPRQRERGDRLAPANAVPRAAARSGGVRVGRAHEANGDADAARRAYGRASDADRRPARGSSAGPGERGRRGRRLRVPDRGAVVKHVLVVDDSATARALVERSLANAGYRVSTAEDGKVALRARRRAPAGSRPPRRRDARARRLADARPPSSDQRVPVIMLSAHDSEAERVRGLLGGADDYVAKPANGLELAARIAAVLRRPPRRSCTTQVYDDGVVRLDASNAAVTVRGTPVQLTPLELRLLDTLTSNAGAVISARELVKRVWEHPLAEPRRTCAPLRRLSAREDRARSQPSGARRQRARARVSVRRDGPGRNRTSARSFEGCRSIR